MFHSSSSRHEQYLVRPSQSKATLTLNKKRSSLESEISGADSGYTSSSSTPSSSSPISPTYHVTSSSSTITNASKKTVNFNDDFTSSSAAASIITASSSSHIEPIKKKKTKRNQPPRQPDLVYSCPRPLAFPFHNDDHFLPIAEADPRDVARVSPSLNRSSSIQSSKTSVGSTRMYTDYNTSHTNNKAVDTESSYSHQSSILSTIQRGTVRSIRSLFQLPDSLSNNNTNRLSRVQTNNTTHTTYSSNTQTSIDNNTNTKLARLEIKKGTVQSIKDMFSKKRASFQSQQVTPVISSQQKSTTTTGMVGATIGQFESSSNYSRATMNMTSNNKKKSDPVFKPVAMNVTKPAQTKSKATSLTSRATEFANRTIWKPKQQPPATKPLPKDPAAAVKTSLKSEVKKFSARIVNSMPKTWRTNDEGNVSLPTTSSANEAPPKPEKKKRSLFSFKRSTTTTTTTTTTTPTVTREDVPSNKKPSATTATAAATVMNDVPPATTVGKMWKSFKSLVTGKKSSRVGVL
ncbi:hypothetical protein BD770DRAFT_385355 [Pilaira anomala]|nr:hypothetical protein BD770DRAFT_385355 [Pilaira anomala]